MKKLLLLLSICFTVIGLSIISYSIYEILHQKQQQTDALSLIKEQIAIGTSFDESTKLENKKPALLGEAIGILEIPTLQEELAIIEGTKEEDLAKGVGHYHHSGLPGDKKQIVLSGHRDTVFRRLGELKIGDILTIRTPKSDKSYKIENTYIVKSNDTSVIRDTYPNEILTLSTCYPFSFIGNAPDRYIIEAKPMTAQKNQ